MTPRTAYPALAVCTLLATLTACGSEPDHKSTSTDSKAPAIGVTNASAESRAPQFGEGSTDPDDFNGDGHRDLKVRVPVAPEPGETGGDERVAVVYGSEQGLDPATHTVHGRRDLGVPQPAEPTVGPDTIAADTIVTADLDGDGFTDFITPVAGEPVQEGNNSVPRGDHYVTWGGPDGSLGKPATLIQLPASVSRQGVEPVVRGDFDGDGHHDLAALAQNQSSLVTLHGPFTRAGEPARTDTSLPWQEGRLLADDIAPSGEPRATSVVLDHLSDGEQTGNTLYPAEPGTGLTADTTELRHGNGLAFGDFDGDGQRDVAVGDDGSRNNEPGHDTEPPEVDGSLAVYPGSGDEPTTYQLPEVPDDAETSYYGPGGYSAADPDGDGRDGILVATYENATLIDGDERIAVLREGPAEVDGEPTPAEWLHARPHGAADFDGDGQDELILHWGPGTLFGLYGTEPTHWWITEGTTSQDQSVVVTTDFATGS